ncbi:MAG: type II toxin-antitoxin system VapC family toxin [Bryobacteraceae bacterium]|nr:type II toxin-antitoxin system VapC family toxin [Bryobacteraceae bacterium]
MLAIVFREPGWEFLAAKLASSRHNVMSAASKVEAATAVYTRMRGRGLVEVEAVYRKYGIEFVPFDEEQADVAIRALETYGKGVHPARLNFGDCLVYAIAKTRDERLFFRGNDFSQTDLTPA